MKCKWCGQEFSPWHDCKKIPVDRKSEAESYLGNMATAAGAGGQFYVMMEPTWNFAGPFVRLILAKASETSFNDTIFDRREIEISKGGWAHLNSKYGDLGKFETFDGLPAAEAKYSEFMKEAIAYARQSDNKL